MKLKYKKLHYELSNEKGVIYRGWSKRKCLDAIMKEGRFEL